MPLNVISGSCDYNHVSAVVNNRMQYVIFEDQTSGYGHSSLYYNFEYTVPIQILNYAPFNHINSLLTNYAPLSGIHISNKSKHNVLTVKQKDTICRAFQNIIT